MDRLSSKLGISRKGSKDKTSAPSRQRSNSTQSQWQQNRFEDQPRTSLQWQWQGHMNERGTWGEVDDQFQVPRTSLQLQGRGDWDGVEKKVRVERASLQWERQVNRDGFDDHYQVPRTSLQLQERCWDDLDDHIQAPRTSLQWERQANRGDFDDQSQMPQTNLQLQGSRRNDFHLSRSNSTQSHNSVRTYPGASHRSKDIAGKVPTALALKRERIIERYTPAALKENAMSSQLGTSVTHIDQTDFHDIELDSHDNIGVRSAGASAPPSYHNLSRPPSSSSSSAHTQSQTQFKQPTPVYQPPRSNCWIDGYEKDAYLDTSSNPYQSELQNHSTSYLANSSQRNWGHSGIREEKGWRRELEIWKSDSKAGRTRRYTAFVVGFFLVLCLVLVLVWWFTRHAGQKNVPVTATSAAG